MFDVFSFWMMRIVYWFAVMLPAGIAISLTEDYLPEVCKGPAALIIGVSVLYGFYVSHVAAKINVVEKLGFFDSFGAAHRRTKQNIHLYLCYLPIIGPWLLPKQEGEEYGEMEKPEEVTKYDR